MQSTKLEKKTVLVNQLVFKDWAGEIVEFW